MIPRQNIPVLMAALVKKARTEGLTPGKTFMQKAFYLIQEGLGIEFIYGKKVSPLEFYPYIYGPYSPDVAFFTDLASGQGMIDMRYDPDGYGVEIREGERSESEIGKLDDESKKAVEKIVNLFVALKKAMPEIPEAGLWELIASVHYVRRRMERAGKECTPEKIKSALVRWKPHLEGADVDKVLELLKELE